MSARHDSRRGRTNFALLLAGFLSIRRPTGREQTPLSEDDDWGSLRFGKHSPPGWWGWKVGRGGAETPPRPRRPSTAAAPRPVVELQYLNTV